MYMCTCTLSLFSSLWPRRLSLWCVVEYIRQLEVRWVIKLKSHTFCSFYFVCGLKRDLVVVVCVVGLVFLFFVAPFSLLAVFQDASAFNQDLSNWNTGAVTNMGGMFQSAAAFTDSTFFCAGSWLTSVIQARDFGGAFPGAVGSGVIDFSCGHDYLHNLMLRIVVDDWCGTDAAKKTAIQTAHGSIEDWDVSRITSMERLFAHKTSFNDDLSKWNTSAVTTMYLSKCTLSPSLLWPRRLPLWVLRIYSRFVGSQFSHVLFFLFSFVV